MSYVKQNRDGTIQVSSKPIAGGTKYATPAEAFAEAQQMTGPQRKENSDRLSEAREAWDEERNALMVAVDKSTTIAGLRDATAALLRFERGM